MISMFSSLGIIASSIIKELGTVSLDYFLATNSVAQTHISGATTVIDFGTEIYDTGGFFTSNVFTVPSGMSGYYAIMSASLFQNIGSAVVDTIRIQRSSDGGTTWTNIADKQSSNRESLNVLVDVMLTANEQFRVVFFSAHVGDRTISLSSLVNFGAVILEPIP